MRIFFYNFFFFSFFLIISRLIPHPPNFTPILATAILAPQIFTKNIYMPIILIILAMFISDLLIGLHSFLIFTYLPLIIIVFLSSLFKEFKTSLVIMTISAPLIFFIISNFGVWTLGDLYAKDLGGLLQCYTLALPFLQNSYAGTIVFMIAYFLIYNLLIFVISKFIPNILSYNSKLVFFKKI